VMKHVPRFYRLLLLVYPRRFRLRYGSEAIRQLQSDLREAGNAGPIKAVFGLFMGTTDFILAGFSERIASRKATAKAMSPPGMSIMMSSFAQDLRFAARSFIKQPAFTIVAVASLALGIGANTAIFSVVNGVLFRALPYEEPESVVQFLGIRQGELDPRHAWLAYPEVEDMRDASEAFAHVAAFQFWTPVLYGSGEPTPINGGSVSASFFQIFGMEPALGRFFLPEEEELGHEPVVVLSYGFWQRRLGGDSSVVGETLDLDGRSYSVVGVAPREFVDPLFNRDVWRSRPPGWDATQLARINHSWRAIGKLAERVTLEQAQADMDRVWLHLAEDYPQAHQGEGVRLVRAKEALVGGVRTAILVLMGAVGLVLLIACANVANLFLTRTVTRGREVALRTALGASRGRIVRQLATEVCLLFLIGGVVGIAVAWVGRDALLALGGQNLPRIGTIEIDGVVLAFTLGVSLVTGLLFGLTAAYPTVRADLATALQVGGRSSSGDRRSHRLRAGLVVAEIALAMMLLAGGGLLLKSLWRIGQVEPGFLAENVLTLRLIPRAGTYAEAEAITRLYEDVLLRTASLPGVRSAGAINSLPMTGAQNCEFVWRDDLPMPTPADFAQYDGPRCLEVRVVSPDYFRAMGVSIVRGRDFSVQDDEAGPPVALINEAAANLAFRGEELVAKRVTLYETRDWLPDVSREIVGVLVNVRQIGLAADAVPAIYIPHAQEPDPGRRWSMTLAVRTARDPIEVAELVRAAVWGVDENLSIDAVQSMEAVVSRSVAGPRFRTILILIFGGVALLLSTVGVAGVVGYAISQRIPEIGLRMALGAQARDIYATVMGQGIKLTALGVLLGVAGAVATTRVLSGLLFGVSVVDPAAFVAASLLLVVMALLAIWIPARRALRVDPVSVLDAE
jgi:putative ABC transport system permease protein